MENKSKIIILATAIVLVMLSGAGFWYWQNKSSAPIDQMLVDEKTTDISLGSQTLRVTRNLLLDKFPETNPLKKIIKNPF